MSQSTRQTRSSSSISRDDALRLLSDCSNLGLTLPYMDFSMACLTHRKEIQDSRRNPKTSKHLGEILSMARKAQTDAASWIYVNNRQKDIQTIWKEVLKRLAESTGERLADSRSSHNGLLKLDFVVPAQGSWRESDERPGNGSIIKPQSTVFTPVSDIQTEPTGVSSATTGEVCPTSRDLGESFGHLRNILRRRGAHTRWSNLPIGECQRVANAGKTALALSTRRCDSPETVYQRSKTYVDQLRNSNWEPGDQETRQALDAVYEQVRKLEEAISSTRAANTSNGMDE